MGRRPRQFAPGIYHIASHGSDRRFLFLTDEDRVDFLERFSDTFWTAEIDVLAYVQLGNHYHGLVRIHDDQLSPALQRLHTEYSRHHNRRHRRRAHLFRAHRLARRINDDNDLLGAYRYLARNPVEAGLVDDPLEWPWASTRAHAGLERAAIPLDETPLRNVLDDSPNWRLHYLQLIQQPDETTAPTRPGWRGETERGGNLRFPPLGFT
jgi:REP element-mobilizing transposase RayT